jgi:phage terminase small subunit
MLGEGRPENQTRKAINAAKDAAFGRPIPNCPAHLREAAKRIAEEREEQEKHLRSFNS